MAHQGDLIVEGERTPTCWPISRTVGGYPIWRVKVRMKS